MRARPVMAGFFFALKTLGIQGESGREKERMERISFGPWYVSRRVLDSMRKRGRLALR